MLKNVRFYIVGFLFLSGLAHAGTEKMTVHRYFAVTSGYPVTFDPIEADLTQNMPLAQMIYVPPMEISGSKGLRSSLLKSFDHFADKKLLRLESRSDARFSDGSPVTAEDIAFAIARITFTYPDWPLVREIVGAEEWRKTASPLKSFPAGIRVEGQIVTIQLSHDVRHPLFRLAMEIFSVIPKRCVDPVKNALSCDEPPSSGPYVVKEKKPDGWLFARRPGVDVLDGRKIPELVSYHVIAPDEAAKVVKTLAEGDVVEAYTGGFSADQLEDMRANGTAREFPSSPFAALVLNPNVEPFRSKACRQIFADEFRKSMTIMGKGVQRPEGSVFVPLLAGYADLPTLEKRRTISEKERDTCLKTLRAHPIKWAWFKKRRTMSMEILDETIKRLGMPPAQAIFDVSPQEFARVFTEGETNAMTSGSEFWPYDPVNDIKMYFSPGMHKSLAVVTKDKKLQEIVDRIYHASGDAKTAGAFTDLTHYLFDEAVYNVYMHDRQFLVGKKGTDAFNQVPVDMAWPKPWQVFDVK